MRKWCTACGCNKRPQVKYLGFNPHRGKGLDDSLDFIDLEASSTDISTLWNPFDSYSDSLQVWFPCAASLVHSVTSRVAKRGTFITDNAPSSHIVKPPLHHRYHVHKLPLNIILTQRMLVCKPKMLYIYGVNG